MHDCNFFSLRDQFKFLSSTVWKIASAFFICSCSLPRGLPVAGAWQEARVGDSRTKEKAAQKLVERRAHMLARLINLRLCTRLLLPRPAPASPPPPACHRLPGPRGWAGYGRGRARHDAKISLWSSAAWARIYWREARRHGGGGGGVAVRV